MNPQELLRKNLNASIDAKKKLCLLPECLETFNAAVELVLKIYRANGQLYIAGNGGSAADAQHLAAEFVSRLSFDRNPLPAEALTVDTSILTAIANDYGYEDIFSRQVEGKMSSKDIFLGITTSGNSPNINKALRTCQKLDISSVVFCGRDGGEAKNLTDYCIIVPGDNTQTIQELHIVLAHSLCEYIESSIFVKNENQA